MREIKKKVRYGFFLFHQKTRKCVEIAKTGVNIEEISERWLRIGGKENRR